MAYKREIDTEMEKRIEEYHDRISGKIPEEEEDDNDKKEEKEK